MSRAGASGRKLAQNFNGTYDLGPMQVNSRWIPELARTWNVDYRTARKAVRDDGCVNVRVAAWILRRKIGEAGGSLYGGIAHYHSATPWRGRRYADSHQRYGTQGLIIHEDAHAKPKKLPKQKKYYYAQR